MDFKISKIQNKDVCNVLLKCLNMLHLKSPHKTLNDISDGVALAEALNEMAPECFDDVWFSTIKKEVGCDNSQKVSNLKKIVEKIDDFYRELNTHAIPIPKRDVVKIVEQSDTMELARLLQLILGVASRCRNAEKYLSHINSRSQKSRTVTRMVMSDLQRIQAGNIEADPKSIIKTNLRVDIDHQEYIQHRNNQLQGVIKSRDLMTLHCQKLDSQICLLQDRKKYFLDKKKHLEGRLYESGEDGLKCNGQRRQIEELKEELSKVETSRDDYRIKFETQEREMFELNANIELLCQTLVYKSKQWFSVEGFGMNGKQIITIQAYKKKYEELVNLEKEVKILETKNIACTQRNMELKQEHKEASAWKSHIEMIKNSVTDLHNKITTPNEIEKLHFETKKLQENLYTLQKEKDRLVTERDSLKYCNGKLRYWQMKKTNTIDHSQADEHTEPDDELQSVEDLKQELVTLQHDNTMLKINQKEPDEDKVSVLQTLLNNTRQQYKELQLYNRAVNEKILKLRSELLAKPEKNIDELNSKVKELQSQIQCEKDTRSMDIKEKNSIISDTDQLIKKLKKSLYNKEFGDREICETCTTNKKMKKM